MPRGDGTGPSGQGFRSGRGRGMGRRGAGRRGAGPGGYCVCPGCGFRVAHQVGTPCAAINCPQCGMSMMREG